MAVKIVVDPGHYGRINPGIIPGYYEGEVMLIIGKLLSWELQKRGAEVTMTRTTNNENPSLESRGRMAAGKDLFISLHSDAAGGEPPDPKIKGVTIYYSVARPDSRDFGRWLSQFVAAAMNTTNNGVRARPYPENPSRDYYAVLRAAVDAGVGTAFLAEQGYHTNLHDCTVLMSDDGQRRIALAHANVIGREYGLGWLYTVQAGDTIYGIARKVYVPWERLVYLNNIDSGYLINPGQVLFIPN